MQITLVVEVSDDERLGVTSEEILEAVKEAAEQGKLGPEIAENLSVDFSMLRFRVVPGTVTEVAGYVGRHY